MLSFPKGQFKVFIECRFPLTNPVAVLVGKDGNSYYLNPVLGLDYISFTGILPLYVDYKYDSFVLEVFDGGYSYGTVQLSLSKVFEKGPMLLGLYPSEAYVQMEAEVLPLPQLYAVFDIECEDLDKMDLFGKSDPYVEIYRKNRLGAWVKVFKSKYIKKTLNPKWDEITIPYDYFCSKGEHLFQDPSQNDTELLIKVWDYDTFTSDDLIGQVTVRFNQLFNTPHSLLRDKKYRSKKDSGLILFKNFAMKQTKGFVDHFVKIRKRISCSFFIDFAGKDNRNRFEDDWVEALDAIAKSFRHNMASRVHIYTHIFNHRNSNPKNSYMLGSKLLLGRKEIVKEFKEKNSIRGLSRVFQETRNKGRTVVQYAALFGPTIVKGVSYKGDGEYHASVYFTDKLFGGTDGGDYTLYRLNENPIPWSAVFVYPPSVGEGGKFNKVGGNSYIRSGSNYSARRNVISKLGKEYASDYTEMASDIYGELVLQAITYYEIDSKSYFH